MTSKIRITLLTGQTIDFNEPEGFSFGVFALSIRETGRFLADQVYVPHDKIVSIMKLDEAGTPVNPEVKSGTLQ